jgi:hypothetical protein
MLNIPNIHIISFVLFQRNDYPNYFAEKSENGFNISRIKCERIKSMN